MLPHNSVLGNGGRFMVTEVHDNKKSSKDAFIVKDNMTLSIARNYLLLFLLQVSDNNNKENMGQNSC